jgi:hypothetical protein
LPAALPFHVEAEEDDPLGAGERGEVDRLIAAVPAVRERSRIARIDGEAVMTQEIGLDARIALADTGVDRDL